MYKLHYLISVLSFIILVGVVGVNLPKKYFDYQKSYFSVQIVLKNVDAPASVKAFQNEINKFESVDRNLFIHKSVAISMMKEHFPSNVNDVLNYNPLPDIIKVYFKTEFATTEVISNWVKIVELEYDNLVEKVSYDQAVLENIEFQENLILKISNIFSWSIIGLAGLGILFMFMSYYKFIERKSFIRKEQVGNMKINNDDNRQFILKQKIKRIGRHTLLEFASFQLIFVGFFVYLLSEFMHYTFVQKYVPEFETILIGSACFYLSLLLIAGMFILISVSKIIKKKKL